MLTTNRVILRQWQDADRDALARLNADHDVMEFYPRTLDRDESDAQFERHRNLIAQHSYGMWCVEERSTGAFVGMMGLPLKRHGRACAMALRRWN
jgi:RimJ/RimL family protein N-acetyltransferase